MSSFSTELYPLSPGSGLCTPCYDLAEFYSENSRVVMSELPVSDVVSVVSLDMLSATNRFAPLSSQGSPVSTEDVDRGVVESPVSDTAVVPSDMSSATCRFTPLNPQGSPMSTEVVESPVSDVAAVVDSDMVAGVTPIFHIWDTI